VFVSAGIVLKAPNGIIDVSGAELVEFLVVSKYDDGYVDLTENSQLKRLLEETAFSLEKRDRSVPIIFDGLDFDLSATHDWLCAASFCRRWRRTDRIWRSACETSATVGRCDLER